MAIVDHSDGDAAERSGDVVDTGCDAHAIGADDVDVPNSRLRSALEFVMAMAIEADRRSLPTPRGLRPLIATGRLTAASLGRARRAVAASPQFRAQAGTVAAEAGVDELGVTWLSRPDGWRERVVLLDRIATERAGREQAEAQERKERRRREAAESKHARLVSGADAESERLSRLEDELQQQRARTVAAQAESADLRSQLATARSQARHAADRLAAAERRIIEAEASSVATSPTAASSLGLDLGEARRLVARLRSLGDDMHALLGPADAAGEGAGSVRRRSPLRLPGSTTGDRRAAAEYLLRSGAETIVDGYNVAKLVWPSETLEEQRARLVDVADDVIRRFGTTITVVFDGADVIGANAPARRLALVTFSPHGVVADDVIVDLVDRLPASQPVVVVTNDGGLRRRVRRLGANLIESETFVEVGRR